jgi:hypothetical protein
VPLELRDDEASLVGSCTADEALEFSDWLANSAQPKVDLAACTHLHAALLQTLLAYKPAITARPADPFLARWISPLL